MTKRNEEWVKCQRKELGLPVFIPYEKEMIIDNPSKIKLLKEELFHQKYKEAL
jgi:hypothetical protein